MSDVVEVSYCGRIINLQDLQIMHRREYLAVYCLRYFTTDIRLINYFQFDNITNHSRLLFGVSPLYLITNRMETILAFFHFPIFKSHVSWIFALRLRHYTWKVTSATFKFKPNRSFRKTIQHFSTENISPLGSMDRLRYSYAHSRKLIVIYRKKVAQCMYCAIQQSDDILRSKITAIYVIQMHFINFQIQMCIHVHILNAIKRRFFSS